MKISSDISYDYKLDKFHTFKLHSPLSICLRILNKCNFCCPHCIASSGPGEKKFLSYSNIEKILTKLAKAGVKRVDITGGEPFLREDIGKILLYAHNLNLATVISSNGSLINDSHIKVLKEAQTFVNISIDGPEEVNDLLRQPNSFQKACGAVKRLAENHIPVRINCTLQKRNYKYIKYMYNLAKELGACSLYFIVVSAQGRAKNLKEDICLSSRQEISLRRTVSKLKKTEDLDIKILDYKYFETACALIDEDANFVSQRFDQEQTKIIGNVLKGNISKMWQTPGAFDHILHLLFYLQYFSNER